MDFVNCIAILECVHPHDTWLRPKVVMLQSPVTQKSQCLTGCYYCYNLLYLKNIYII